MASLSTMPTELLILILGSCEIKTAAHLGGSSCRLRGIWLQHFDRIVEHSITPLVQDFKIAKALAIAEIDLAELASSTENGSDPPEDYWWSPSCLGFEPRYSHSSTFLVYARERLLPQIPPDHRSCFSCLERMLFNARLASDAHESYLRRLGRKPSRLNTTIPRQDLMSAYYTVRRIALSHLDPKYREELDRELENASAYIIDCCLMVVHTLCYDMAYLEDDDEPLGMFGCFAMWDVFGHEHEDEDRLSWVMEEWRYAADKLEMVSRRWRPEDLVNFEQFRRTHY